MNVKENEARPTPKCFGRAPKCFKMLWPDPEMLKNLSAGRQNALKSFGRTRNAPAETSRDRPGPTGTRPGLPKNPEIRKSAKM